MIQTIVEGFKSTEVGVIPSDWEVKRLEEVAEVVGGGTPSTFIKEYWDGDINWFTPTEIGYSKYVVESKRKISNKGFENSSARILPIGTTLLTSRAGIGDVSILMNEACTNQGFQSLVPKKNIVSEYLYYSVLNLKQVLIQFASGSTFLEISPARVKATRILLPNLTEQTAIATALSDADALINQLEQLLTKKRNIKTGAMQELLSPKEGWVVKKLGEVAEIYRGGSPRPIEAFLTRDVNGINWIKIGDVHSSAKYIHSTSEKIIAKGTAYSRAVKEGDFLLSNSMSFGRPFILRTSGCIHDGWLVIQNYQGTFNTDFLYYLLSFETTLNQYRTLAAGSSVLNLNKEIVKRVKVSFPNLLEQTRIAQILSDMDNEIEELEKQVEKYKMLKQGMMQSLLTGKIRLV